VGGSVRLGPDSRRIYFERKRARKAASGRVAVDGKGVRKVVDKAVNGELALSPDGKTMCSRAQTTVASRGRFPRAVRTEAVSTAVTHANDALVRGISMREAESVSDSRGAAGGETSDVDCEVRQGFDPTKKYPLVFWCMAGRRARFNGCVVVSLERATLGPRQGYMLAQLEGVRAGAPVSLTEVDEISHDWGGKVSPISWRGWAIWNSNPTSTASGWRRPEHRMAGTLMTGSGHTAKFKTLVRTAGLRFPHHVRRTDELWFDEWEHGIPWQTAEFDKFSRTVSRLTSRRRI